MGKGKGATGTKEPVGRIFFLDGDQVRFEEVGLGRPEEHAGWILPPGHPGVSEEESLRAHDWAQSISGSLEPGMVAELARTLRREGRFFGDVAVYVTLHLVREYEERLRRGTERQGENAMHRELLRAGHIREEAGEDGARSLVVDMSEERGTKTIAGLSRTIEGFFVVEQDGGSEAENEAAWWMSVAHCVWTHALLWKAQDVMSEAGGVEAARKMGADAFAEDVCGRLGDDILGHLADRESGHYRAVAQMHAYRYVDALDLPRLRSSRIQEALGFGPNDPEGLAPRHALPNEGEDHYEWPSGDGLFETSRSVGLGAKAWETNQEHRYPQASFGDDKSYALMRPVEKDEPNRFLSEEEEEALAEKMWRQCADMGDLDSDVFDMLGIICVDRRDKKGWATCTVDDLLDMRQLEKKEGGDGRRGGYYATQRRDVSDALDRIESLWVSLFEVGFFDERKGKYVKETVQDRAYHFGVRAGQMRLDGSLEWARFRFAPGEVFERFLFGRGRQLQLLSKKIFQYRLDEHPHEKKLGKYLSWQWRTNSRNILRPHVVSTLLTEADIQFEQRNPSRSKKRLHAVLGNLKGDGIIRDHDYCGREPGPEDGRGWWKAWLSARVVVEPPEAVKDYVVDRGRAREKYLPEPSVEQEKRRAFGDELRRVRKERGRSQTQLAEDLSDDELQTTQGTLSKIEAGRQKPSPQLRKRIERWIESGVTYSTVTDGLDEYVF